ncbi:MAG: 4Fe-4S binding protein [Erysipelotrichaceae bacterium]|nr:4Fe-4S binding protein [Erysipelotrichaceae bacterium]
MNILQYRSANCKNCYKCIRNCPVKAIQFRKEKAKIIHHECIYCGTCVNVCPQDAKVLRDDLPTVLQWLQEGKKVIASVAPSYVAAFGVTSFEALKKALVQMGFYDAFETAHGASMVKSEYERILNEEKPDLLISSCCSSLNLLIQKYYPTLIPYLAKVASPMLAHGQYLKQQHEDAMVVFVGPCFAKKEEAENAEEHFIDATITFKELSQYFETHQVVLEDLDCADQKLSRLFPKAGGVIQTMEPNQMYDYISVDGAKACMEVLDELEQGNMKHIFLEMNICEGGCVQGPGMPASRVGRMEVQRKLTKVSGKQYHLDFDHSLDTVAKVTFENLQRGNVMPSQEQLQEIYQRMGKVSERDFLNCGACGYDSCKEKAIAIYQGKADVNMCLPFMKEKAETVSKQVLKVSPNAVISLDLDFKIQSFNPTAYKLFDINPNVQVLGEDIEHWLDVDQFVGVLTEGPMMDVISYLPKNQKYVEKRVVYDEDVQMILIIMKDVTEQQQKLEQRKSLKNNTIEITDNIINKQMRIVQEIASLLGETTAETKVALKHLRDFVIEEEQE